MHHMDSNKTTGEEARRQLHKNAASNQTPQDTKCTAACLLSRKLFKLDEPDMEDTAGEAGTKQDKATLTQGHKWCTLMDPHT